MLCGDILNQEMKEEMEGNDLQLSFQGKHFPKTWKGWGFWVESDQQHIRSSWSKGTALGLHSVSMLTSYLYCHFSWWLLKDNSAMSSWRSFTGSPSVGSEKLFSKILDYLDNPTETSYFFPQMFLFLLFLLNSLTTFKVEKIIQDKYFI